MEKLLDQKVVTICDACKSCADIRERYINSNSSGCSDEKLLERRQQLVMRIESFRQMICRELKLHSATSFSAICADPQACERIKNNLRDAYRAIKKHHDSLSHTTGGPYATA